MKRTIYCGDFRENHIGNTECACGWVQTVRDMGGIIFIDLKDREGTLQVVFDLKNLSDNDFKSVEGLKPQTVIAVEGVVKKRDDETINPKIATGTVELIANQIEVLSTANPLPFSLDEEVSVREDLRLKYRFLDLRHTKLLNNLKIRHKVQKAAQDYLDDMGFLAVETPMLTKSTPEGARDYLVPSRVHPGCFYALPQSPQIFKQLLMVGGIDKYYQVAKCFRDEDLRADRQPEFTQVDMEMSFIDQEDILVHLEKMFKYIFKQVKGVEIKEKFIRLTWQEAMDIYGSDKPDLRFDLPIVELTDWAEKCSFAVFKNVCKDGGAVRAINVPGGASFTRSTIEALTQKALGYGAKGMAWISVKENGELYSVLTKYFKEEQLKELLERTNSKPGDFILFCADKLDVVRKTLGGLRLDVADIFGLRNKDEYKFLFVVDFPQFEYSQEQGRYIAMHHPFTMPYPEDIEFLETAPEKVRAQAYDVVLNGIELGSGSIRIHRDDIQQKMFNALGFSDEEIESRFGFMVNAFKYGTPPHGGFAFGLDRLVMLMVGAESLREVIAFPKNKEAVCPMTEAPGTVDSEQLEVLNLINGFVTEHIDEINTDKKKKEIDVLNVANLARLKLSKEEEKSLAVEMKDIINFANQLEDFDTKDIPVTAHIVPLQNVFREDEVIPSADRDLLLENAPTKEDGYVLVPHVID